MLILEVSDIVIDVVDIGNTKNLKELVLSELLVKGPFALVGFKLTTFGVRLSFLVWLLRVLYDITSEVAVLNLSNGLSLLTLLLCFERYL